MLFVLCRQCCAMSSEQSLDGLNLLLTAPDKDAILKCANLVFATRREDPSVINKYFEYNSFTDG